MEAGQRDRERERSRQRYIERWEIYWIIFRFTGGFETTNNFLGGDVTIKKL